MFFQEVHLHTFAHNMEKYLELRLNLIFITTFTTPTSNHIIATCVEILQVNIKQHMVNHKKRSHKAVQLYKIGEDILVLSKYAFIICGLGFTSEYQVGEFNKSK